MTPFNERKAVKGVRHKGIVVTQADIDIRCAAPEAYCGRRPRICVCFHDFYAAGPRMKEYRKPLRRGPSRHEGFIVAAFYPPYAHDHVIESTG